MYVWPYRLQPGSRFQAWPPTLSLHNVVHVVQSAPLPSPLSCLALEVGAHKAQAPTSVAWLDHLLILILDAKLRHRVLMAAVAPALALPVFRSFEGNRQCVNVGLNGTSPIGEFKLVV